MACASRGGTQQQNGRSFSRTETNRKLSMKLPKREAYNVDDDDRLHPRRWSTEEDERLRTSVEKHHGTNWKDIAAEVKTRNHVQCLQRWKKVLTPGLVKGQWSREEDDILTALVNEGHKNWGSLAARIPGRTSKQCRERWCHHLDPRIVKGEWTEEEDRTIVSMHDKMGNKWATIAQHLIGRTENATKIRWKILERNMKNGHDAHKQDKRPRGASNRHGTDARLRRLAAQAAASVLSRTNEDIHPVGVPENPIAVHDVLGESYAGDVAEDLPFANKRLRSRDAAAAATSAMAALTASTFVPTATSTNGDHACGQDQGGHARTGKKRKMPGGEHEAGSDAVDFAEEVSDPKPGKGGGEGNCGRRGWLPEEDSRLRQAVDKFGERNWRYVAQSVGTRTHIQCQQRWKKALRPGLVKGAWSLEEDENLVTLIGQGFTNWSELASHTPGRTAKQCRERWCHHLDPSVNHGTWTDEEDRLLCSLEARLGTKWAAIAREMPGRTEHAVKGRFKTLSRERRVGGVGTHPGRNSKGLGHRIQKGAGTGTVDSHMPSRLDVQQRLTPQPQPPQPPPKAQSPREYGNPSGNHGVAMLGGVGMAPAPLLMQPPSDLFDVRAKGGNQARHAAVDASGDTREHAMLEQQKQPLLQQHSADDTQQHQQLMQQLQLGQFSPALVSVPPKPENGLLRNEQQSDGGAVSITRLLSISSSGTESLAALPEVTSGYCGSGRVPDSKTASLSVMASQERSCSSSGGVIQTQPSLSEEMMGGGPQLNHRQQGPGQQTRGEVGQRGAMSPFPGANDKLLLSLPVDKDICSDGLNPGLLESGASSSVSVASSLVNKPSAVDYSDLASILMDGFNAHQDAVGAGSEFVTLGEDPYSDYSLSGTPYIMQYGARAGPPAEQLPLMVEDKAGFGELYGDLSSVSSDLTEALAAGVFDGDPCDPYF